MQNKITECPAEEAAAAAAAAVDDRATIDWGRATKLGVEMKNILPSSLGEIGGGGGGCGGESSAGFCVARERRGAQALC